MRTRSVGAVRKIGDANGHGSVFHNVGGQNHRTSVAIKLSLAIGAGLPRHRHPLAGATSTKLVNELRQERSFE